MSEATKGRRGRPPKPPSERRRHVLAVRLNDQTRADLEAVAEENGRRLAEEAEVRLVRSLGGEDRLAEMQELPGGGPLVALLILLGEEIYQAAAEGVALSQGGKVEFDSWPDDPFAFDRALRAACRLLDDLRPEGAIEVPERLKQLLPRASWTEFLKAGPPPLMFSQDHSWTYAQASNPFLKQWAARAERSMQKAQPKARATPKTRRKPKK